MLLFDCCIMVVSVVAFCLLFVACCVHIAVLLVVVRCACCLSYVCCALCIGCRLLVVGRCV